MISVNIIWRAALESSVTLLLLGTAWAVVATWQVQRVVRKDRRLRAASGRAGPDERPRRASVGRSW